jgi:cytochrome P450
MLPTAPDSPLAAVTHPNPYPYYAGLVKERPFYRDEALGTWVASSARAVTAVLESEACRVRPATEPVPAPLCGSASGFLFGRLLRMTDGAAHSPLKRALSLTLASLDEGRLGAHAQSCAQRLARQTLGPATPEGLDAFAFGLSVHVVASLLGLPERRFLEVREATEAYLAGLGPNASPACLRRGAEGTGVLLELVEAQLASARPPGLLKRLREEASRADVKGKDVLIANAAGLLTQAYEASAGLIGNTALALAARPKVARALRRAPGGLDSVLAEVLRHDAPVQNTRRFVGREVAICGQPLAKGDVVLVLLAAANRDAEANPEPERFEPFRTARRIFTFGWGAHLCPGPALALAIARAGVERLLATELDFGKLAALAYRPSLNVRVPRFV